MRFFKNTTLNTEQYSPEPCTESQLLALTDEFRGISKIKFVSQGDVLLVESISVDGKSVIVGHLDRGRGKTDE